MDKQNSKLNELIQDQIKQNSIQENIQGSIQRCRHPSTEQKQSKREY